MRYRKFVLSRIYIYHELVSTVTVIEIKVYRNAHAGASMDGIIAPEAPFVSDF